jgi:uncharacterized membrane protein YfcA
MLNLLFDKVTFPVSGVQTYWWLPGMVAFGISFFTSMGGLSGAFLLLPFQVSILGFNSPAVSPTNLIYNVFAIPGGVYRYIREDRMLWSLALVTVAGTLPGIIIGAFMRVYLFSNPRTFKLFVGLVLLYIGVRLALTIIKKAEGKKIPQSFNINPGKLTLKKIEYCFDGADYSAPTPMIFLLAAIVGIIGGAYGIGGGAIISPFIVAVFGFPIYTVAGAALLGTLVTSVAGVAIYQFLMPAIFSSQTAINPDWLLGMSMGAGGLIGIYLGARLQRYFPDRFIKIMLIISIGVVVIRYVGGYFLK